jgi:streptogramin lyase
MIRRLGRGGLVVLSLLAMAMATSPSVGASSGSSNPIDYFFVGSLDPRPFWITPGPDGNLWFTDSSADAIGRITPAGVITEFPIGEGKEPYAIVAGADGNLWFTERQNNKVGAVNTSGALVHEYFVPGADPRPAGIAAAPNGDIWFTTQGSGDLIQNSAGRIRPNGTMTLYPLYPCACFPLGITTGPDGNLWAVEEQGVYQGESPGTLDKISPDGSTITRYPVPAQPLQPGHLPAFNAPGPDGNVWFTEFAADLHRVGKITPNGAVTEYTLPGTLTSSVGVTTGPDGRMWITQSDAGQVVVMTTAGQAVAAIPVHHGPSGITVGPDGNMWFAAALDGEIGRLRTARAGFAYVLDIASGFTPTVRAVQLGTRVEWVLEAPGMHGVQDSTGLSLFNSGLKPPVSFFVYRFVAAGTFPYSDPGSARTGTIAVPVNAPSAGQTGVAFQVQWALGSTPANRVYDVQVQLPGSTTWEPWKTGVTINHAAYTPSGAGSYGFRARIRQEATASGWSPPRMVTVT